MHETIVPKELRILGHFKFLTFQCLLIQLLNAILHVGAHFMSFLKKPRDFVFTSLAYPIGSIVVYSFWVVWHLLGRELIFPAALEEFYPSWLNHVTHTIIAPLNILMAILICHKYTTSLWTVLYLVFYTILLHYIKFKTGMFVYRYLEEMDEVARIVYFAGSGVLAYLIYKSGQLLTNVVHGKAAQSQKSPPKQKAKQK